MLPRVRGSRWLSWRYSWPTRFAHHPLCERHRIETWRIGRLHLCRGCASMGLGLLLGTSAVWMLGTDWTGPLLLALGLPLLLGSWPRWYPRWPRPLRDLLRLALGVCIPALTAWTALHPLLALLVVPIVLLGLARFRRARIAVNARRCEGCPELGQGVCSGYALQVQAQRRLALELEARLLRSWES